MPPVPTGDEPQPDPVAPGRANPRSRVVGLGSPFGDDRAGWEAVALLREALPPGARAEVASDPLAVLDKPPGCEILVVIDACRGAGPPGSVHRFGWPDPRLGAAGAVSSHGVGLAAALELAGTMGRLPARVVVFAVEGASEVLSDGLSRAAAAAIPEVAARVLAELGGAEGMSDAVSPEFLRSLAFLAPATDDELRRLAPAARVESHAAGAVLFREGEELDRVFVVTAGTAALEINGRDYRPRRFQTVGTGELIGWSPILGLGSMTATARALTDAMVLALDARAVLELCEQDPRFGYQFMRRTAAALAARLSATRLQLLDVYKHELPAAAPEGGGS
jgi:hydrogenase maturation protease